MLRLIVMLGLLAGTAILIGHPIAAGTILIGGLGTWLVLSKRGVV